MGVDAAPQPDHAASRPGRRDRTAAPDAEVVGPPDRGRVDRPRPPGVAGDGGPLAGAVGSEPAPLARCRRRTPPPARPDHRPLPRPHGAPGCEEGRPDPRRRRLADPRPRLRPPPSRQPGQGSRRPRRLRLPAFGGRRVLPARLHRASGRRDREHRGRVLGPRPGLVRRPWHHPHHPGGHRQRIVLPIESVRPRHRTRRPAPADQAVHAQAQREGRALPAHPHRRTALRPPVHLRSRSGTRDRGLERALQLPSTAHRRREPATRSTPRPWRHQRDALIHLAGLFRRMGRWRVKPGWYTVVLLLPGVLALAATVLNVLFGAERPSAAELNAWPELFVTFAFVLLVPGVGGAWEEPGWRGFAVPRLQVGQSALVASLILGVLIAGWHIPLMIAGQVAYSDIVLILAAVVVFNWCSTMQQAAC